MNVFETKDWFSVADTAARLTRIEGTPVSTDDVLQLLICGKLQASIRSGQVFATPLVAMTEVESQSFIGTSWTKPNGERIARTGDEVVLTAIFPLLDLPVCLSGVGHLVNNAYENSLDVSKQVPIPPGTLLQTPNKDEYFAVLGGTDIPGTNGQIVIRTDALREYQSRLIVHKKYLAANDDAAAVVAESASGSVEPTKAGPVPVEQGLSTKDIARAFDGVNEWDADRWPKNLSAAKWLHPARIAIGGAGGASSVWSPMMLAQLMHDRTKGVREKEKLMKVLNSRFTLNPALGLWRDAFNEYFATYCATD